MFVLCFFVIILGVLFTLRQGRTLYIQEHGNYFKRQKCHNLLIWVCLALKINATEEYNKNPII
jgi:hypothetical protein